MNKQELASRIWNIANSLRKKIKASEYKDYILGLMFYKYLSDKELEFLYSNQGTLEDLKDIDEEMINYIVDGIGYYINYEDLFSSLKEKGIKLGAKDVSIALENFNKNINHDYKNVFEGVFSTLENGLTKLGENSGSRDRAIRDLVGLVSDIPATSKDYDIMGYVYEFLLKKFSNEAKANGAFYTPAEVSTLKSRIIADRMKDRTELSIYDCCLGSGGLLLTIGEEASRYVNANRIKYYGQELITETYNLARENLVMKGIPAQNICVRNGDTLDEDWPYFDEEHAYEPLFVDACSANPPYSMIYDPFSHKDDPRFKNYGYAPKSAADYAFLLHCLYHIKDDGIMTIVLPHGVLFRGGSEGEIRKNLIKNHNIETIIGLPSNLFLSTGIPTVILVLSKNRKAGDVLFVDASKGFKKESTQNVLREKDVQRIFDVVTKRESVENFSRLVSIEEIEANDYNLNIPRYVSASEESESYDLYSLMTGEIAESEIHKFNGFLNEFPSLKDELFLNDDGYLRFKTKEIKETISNNSDVKKFLESHRNFCKELEEKYSRMLFDEKYTKETQFEIKELFLHSDCNKLIDNYDLYEIIANRWKEIALDKELIVIEGMEVCKKIEPNMVSKKIGDNYVDEQKGWKGSIFDFDLIKKEFFKADYEKASALENEANANKDEYTELLEGLDDTVKVLITKDNDNSVIDPKKLKAEIKNNSDDIETFKTIEKLIEKEKDNRKASKQVIASLDVKAEEKVQSLTDEEIRCLLIKKWVNPIIEEVIKLGDNAVNDFVKGLQSLQSKYSNSISDIDKEIEETSKVLVSMMEELEGNSKDMKALEMFMEALR